MDEIEVTRTQIEETRSQMSETIDAIQERLSPDRLVQQAKDTVREATIGRVQDAVGGVVDQAKELTGNAMETTKEMANTAVNSTMDAGSSAVDFIRQNPVPAALVGIGLGWLWMSARKQNMGAVSLSSAPSGRAVDYNYDRENNRWRAQYSSPSAGGGTRSGLGQAVSQAQDTVGQVAGQVKDQVGNLADQAQDQAGQAADWFQTTLQQNPLAIGIAALALGAVVGLSIPQTQPENQWMGPARDNLAGMAQQKVQDLGQKVVSVAQEAVGSAKDAAMEEAKNQGLAPQSS